MTRGVIKEMQGRFGILKLISVIHHIDINDIIISVSTEKALDKFQHPFTRKSLSNGGMERTPSP